MANVNRKGQMFFLDDKWKMPNAWFTQSIPSVDIESWHARIGRFSKPYEVKHCGRAFKIKKFELEQIYEACQVVPLKRKFVRSFDLQTLSIMKYFTFSMGYFTELFVFIVVFILHLKTRELCKMHSLVWSHRTLQKRQYIFHSLLLSLCNLVCFVAISPVLPLLCSRRVIVSV